MRSTWSGPTACLALALTLAGAAGCGDNGSGGSDAGGVQGDGGDGGGAGDAGGTSGSCESNCVRSVALHCPMAPYADQAGCVQLCQREAAMCQGSGHGPAFQAYLDCVQTTRLECGMHTMAPNPPMCLDQSVAILMCVGGGPADAGTGG